jgi:hypothetical protein
VERVSVREEDEEEEEERESRGATHRSVCWA